GADSITFHIEATPHPHRLLGAIAEAGCVPGLAINPGTPAGAASELAGLAGIICCMTVNPGWGGQRFIPTSPGKVEQLRALDGAPAIEVDGGIDVNTAFSVVEAGADLLVAGSAIFAADDPASAYHAIAAAAGAVGSPTDDEPGPRSA
ncbi:MAG: ribulose-phosphate 3-epimerase, partial [Solirubrobacterales bacterium]